MNNNKDPSSSLLACWEKGENEKHGKHCHNKWMHFSPFVLSIDRILGEDAQVLLRKLS